MKRKEIHFLIDREGNIQSQIKGIKGSACSSIAAKFKDLGQIIEQKHTNEFFESGSSSQISLALKRDG